MKTFMFVIVGHGRYFVTSNSESDARKALKDELTSTLGWLYTPEEVTKMATSATVIATCDNFRVNDKEVEPNKVMFV